MKSEQVMHHYVGARITAIRPNTDLAFTGNLIGYKTYEDRAMPECCIQLGSTNDNWVYESICRLQLRYKHEMSEDETAKYESLKTVWVVNRGENYQTTIDNAESIQYLCSIGVDCNGLIEAKEADHNPEAYR